MQQKGLVSSLHPPFISYLVTNSNQCYFQLQLLFRPTLASLIPFVFHWQTQRHKAMNDRLTELPDAILLFIQSSFTMKQVAKLGLVSHRLHYIWRCFYRLHFEDFRATRRFVNSWVQGLQFHHEERSDFATWVSRVLDKHLGTNIDEFKVAFVLDKTYQSHVDKWVALAVEKQVKILELDFSSLNSADMRLHLNNHLPSSFATLTSLRLYAVNVSDQFINCLVRTCSSLENLCVGLSLLLINISLVSVSLQCLEVNYCHRLKSVNISAPKLRSFILHGHPVEINVKHAYSLSKVCIGDQRVRYSINYVFDSPLVDYFLQLEHLSLTMHLHCKLNRVINNPPTALANVKHLELCVFGRNNKSLLGWTSFIGALPSLERLRLKLSCYEVGYTREIKKQEGPPLKSLKTLEVCGFIGRRIDLEIATYVVENAIALEQVIVDYRQQFLNSMFHKKSFHLDESAPTRLVDLQMKLPPGVNLIFKPME